jgi:hypothetical protein
MGLQERAHKRRVADASLHERMARLAGDSGERIEISGIGEGVEIDDGGWLLGDPLPHELAADEAGAAGHEDGLHAVLSSSGRESPRVVATVAGASRPLACR